MNNCRISTLLGIIIMGCIFCGCANKKKGLEIILTNKSSINLTDKAISIKRSQLHSIPKDSVYPLLLDNNLDTIPVQFDDTDGDKHGDELFFVVNLNANASTTYSLTWLPSEPAYTKRTSVRFGKRSSASIPIHSSLADTAYSKNLPKNLGFQPYQTDGPSWENDKVGFRHYLDGRNAKDVFGKLIPGMSPENVGISATGAVEDNYHVMEKWGRDILAVGNSIGIGGLALLDDKKFLRLGTIVGDSINNVEQTTFNILAEGPVKSVINFRYNNWHPNGSDYTLKETGSIWPGMYAYHNSVELTGLKGNENLLIGMVNINAVKPPVEIKTDKNWVILVSHERHTYNKEWWLGLALVLPADAYLGFTNAPDTGKLTKSWLAKLKVVDNKPANYFVVAGWELSDKGFADPVYFKNYVVNLVEQLSAEVSVKVQ